MTVYTIGHSTRTIERFIEMLGEHGIALLVDIRTVPRSRKNPQFNKDTLPGSLEAAGIGYTHMAGLGGLRKPLKDSRNTAWRNESFRGYADYMQTPAFEESLNELMERAAKDVTGIMCAEAVHWRCHRSLVADALLVRGIDVEHILDQGTRRHSLTSFAVAEGERVTYPEER